MPLAVPLFAVSALGVQLLDLPTSSMIILFCGTLLHLKGVDVLIKAFADVVSQVPDSLLLIIGPDGQSDQYRRQLIWLATSLGIISKVRFVGPLEWHELARFYRASDLFVLPTRKDVWPQVLVEAGLAGLPLITTDACGAEGYLVQSERNGFVIPVDNIKMLGEVIHKLSNPSIRLEFGKESEKIIGAPSKA